MQPSNTAGLEQLDHSQLGEPGRLWVVELALVKLYLFHSLLSKKLSYVDSSGPEPAMTLQSTIRPQTKPYLCLYTPLHPGLGRVAVTGTDVVDKHVVLHQQGRVPLSLKAVHFQYSVDHDWHTRCAAVQALVEGGTELEEVPGCCMG